MPLWSVNSGCNQAFFQRTSRRTRKLFFGWLEDGAYAVYHGCYYDLEEFTKERNDGEKQLAKRKIYVATL